jgi:hypothetical protein
MSVIMTLRAKADSAALERLAAENPEKLQTIVERADTMNIGDEGGWGAED